MTTPSEGQTRVLVPLIGTDEDIHRFAMAQRLGGNRYLIISKAPLGEIWAYDAGSIVIGKLDGDHVRVIGYEEDVRGFWSLRSRKADSSRFPAWRAWVIGFFAAGVLIAIIVALNA